MCMHIYTWTRVYERVCHVDVGVYPRTSAHTSIRIHTYTCARVCARVRVSCGCVCVYPRVNMYVCVPEDPSQTPGPVVGTCLVGPTSSLGTSRNTGPTPDPVRQDRRERCRRIVFVSPSYRDPPAGQSRLDVRPRDLRHSTGTTPSDHPVGSGHPVVSFHLGKALSRPQAHSSLPSPPLRLHGPPQGSGVPSRYHKSVTM